MLFVVADEVGVVGAVVAMLVAGVAVVVGVSFDAGAGGGLLDAVVAAVVVVAYGAWNLGPRRRHHHHRRRHHLHLRRHRRHYRLPSHHCYYLQRRPAASVSFYAAIVCLSYKSPDHNIRMDMVARQYVSFDVASNDSSARRHAGMFRI